MRHEPFILFENPDIVVLDKPSGSVVTPGPGYEEEDTLVGWLLQRYGEGLREVGSGGHRPGIVHRLDKDTSGVMVAAKTQPAFEHMVAQFKKRHVTKEYVAVVWGNILNKLSSGQTTFIVNAPIGRNPNNRMRWAIVGSGKVAETRFEVMAVVEGDDSEVFSVVRCYPKTGRTHQLRVHLKAFGYGIVGDPLYQSRKEHERLKHFVQGGAIENRLYLHAHSLEFTLPHGPRESFTSSLPDAFGTFVDGL